MSPRELSGTPAHTEEAGSRPTDSTKPAADQPKHEDRATAFHEAGHAIVALSLGRSVEKLTIVRNSLRLGSVQFGSRRAGKRQDDFEKQALILLAGVVSEAKVTGRYNWPGAQQDLYQVQSLIATRGGSEKSAERLQKRLFEKVGHLLEDPALWSAVEKLAEMLLDHGSVSGRAARHIFNQAVNDNHPS